MADVDRDLRQRLTGLEPPCALDMQGEITIAEAEPVLAAQRADGLHERPGLVPAAPPGDGIVEAGQHVGQRIDIGRDAEAEMLEIVARVGDNQQFVRRQHAAQAKRQLGAADTARQRHDETAAHRNMSSLAGRTRLAAGLAALFQVRPRTSTTGCASSPWPITSEAAAAISSAKPEMLTCRILPNRSGLPRRSSSAGRPAAPMAMPWVPRRHARPK